MPLKSLLRPVYAAPLRRYRNWQAMRNDQRRIGAEVDDALRKGRAVKIIIGAGDTRFPGWIATDIPAFNTTVAAHWQRLFPPRSIDRMLAEHVFEHLTPAQFGAFLRLAREFLSADGWIRIAVPDGNHPSADYIARVRPGGIGAGADDHKVLYTHESLTDAVATQGYNCDLLEHFDADGQFHMVAWNAEDGYISRSALNDSRNRDGQLRYTSLIVDCMPR